MTRSDYYCLIGLCGIVFLVYAQLWLPGLVLIKRDAFQFFLPIKQYIFERLSAGELPQWFPYEGLGRPLLSIPVTGVFHPFTLLYWILPVHEAYRLSTLLSCIAGALGAYLLGRTLKLSAAGALVSALGFSCSGYVVSLTENLVYLYSICMLPSFLVVLEKVLATRKLFWIGVSALLWSSVFLNGDVQTGFYYGCIALVWSAFRFRGLWSHAATCLLLLAVLSSLLAGIQLAPAWTTFGQSNRTEASVFHDQAMHWSTHPFRLSALVVSPLGASDQEERIAHDLFGNTEPGRGAAGYWAESIYLGLPIIGLALIGLAQRRDLRVCAVLSVCCLALALGRYGGLYELCYQIVPLWSAFRYPEKFVGVTSLFLAILAGGGFEVIREGRSWSSPWFVSGAVFLGFSAFLASELSGQWFVNAFKISQGLATHLAAATAQASLFAAIVGIGMGLLVTWFRVTPLQQTHATIVMLALIVCDLSRANLPSLHTASSQTWSFRPGLAEAVMKDSGVEGPGHFRILSLKDPTADLSVQVHDTLTPRERAAVLRKHALDVEHNATFQIESAQGYLPGYSAAFQLAGGLMRTQSLGRYNVAYLIGRPSRFGGPRYHDKVVAVVSDYDLALVKNPALVKPRAYLSMKPELTASAVAVGSLLERPDFLNGEVDVVEGGTRKYFEPLDGGTARILSYKPEEVRIEVDAPQSAMLILLDSFQSGWRAFQADGGELPILKANAMVRAVEVPAGASTVTFLYQAPLLKVGAGASLIGLAVCISLLATRRRCPFVR